MAEVKKILGQADLAATSLTDVYTVPASTEAVISTITIANRAAASATFRLSVAVGGAADTNAQYLYYDITLAGNATFAATLGITLATTDVVRAFASSTNLSVNIFGVEIS